MKKKGINIVILLFLLGIGMVSNGQSSRDSCITRLKIYTYKPVDSSTNLISKKAVANFMKRINDCLSEKYPYEQEDKAFEIWAPTYLTEHGCWFGKYSFAFQLKDTSFMYATLRRIEIHYDFKGEERKFFQNLIDRGQQKIQWQEIEGRKIQLYKSSDGLFNGRLDLDNNTFIMFSTGNKNYQEELIRSILTFKWK